MTLEAWVQARRPDRLAHGDLQGVRRRAGLRAVRQQRRRHAQRARRHRAATPASTAPQDLDPNEWTHLAAHVRRQHPAAVRQRRAGRLASRPGRCSPTGPGPLTIGGNNVWGEHFRGPDRRGPGLQPPRSPATRSAPTWAQPVVAGTPKPPADTGPDAIGKFAAPQAVADHARAPGADCPTARSRPGTASRPPLNSEHTGIRGRARSTRSRPAATCSAPATSRSPDGRLLVAGGHIRPTRARRTRTSSTRRRARGRAAPDMSVARWYPTATGAAGRPRVRGLGRQHHARRPAEHSRCR